MSALTHLAKQTLRMMGLFFRLSRIIPILIVLLGFVSISSPVVRGEGSCFTAGTQVILADGSTKNIEDVQIGEVLLGQAGAHNTVLAFDHVTLGDRKLYSFNGGRFFVEDEHPFLATDGVWRSIDPAATLRESPNLEVQKLHIGDTLVTIDGTVEIVSIDSQEAEPDLALYNFILDGNHTYFADSYLVHNKDGECSIYTKSYLVWNNDCDVGCGAGKETGVLHQTKRDYYYVGSGDGRYQTYGCVTTQVDLERPCRHYNFCAIPAGCAATCPSTFYSQVFGINMDLISDDPAMCRYGGWDSGDYHCVEAPAGSESVFNKMYCEGGEDNAWMSNENMGVCNPPPPPSCEIDWDTDIVTATPTDPATATMTLKLGGGTTAWRYKCSGPVTLPVDGDWSDWTAVTLPTNGSLTESFDMDFAVNQTSYETCQIEVKNKSNNTYSCNTKKLLIEPANPFLTCSIKWSDKDLTINAGESSDLEWVIKKPGPTRYWYECQKGTTSIQTDWKPLSSNADFAKKETISFAPTEFGKAKCTLHIEDEATGDAGKCETLDSLSVTGSLIAPTAAWSSDSIAPNEPVTLNWSLPDGAVGWRYKYDGIRYGVEDNYGDFYTGEEWGEWSLAQDVVQNTASFTFPAGTFIANQRDDSVTFTVQALFGDDSTKSDSTTLTVSGPGCSVSWDDPDATVSPGDQVGITWDTTSDVFQTRWTCTGALNAYTQPDWYPINSSQQQGTGILDTPASISNGSATCTIEVRNDNGIESSCSTGTLTITSDPDDPDPGVNNFFGANYTPGSSPTCGCIFPDQHCGTYADTCNVADACDGTKDCSALPGYPGSSYSYNPVPNCPAPVPYNYMKPTGQYDQYNNPITEPECDGDDSWRCCYCDTYQAQDDGCQEGNSYTGTMDCTEPDFTNDDPTIFKADHNKVVTPNFYEVQTGIGSYYFVIKYQGGDMTIPDQKFTSSSFNANFSKAGKYDLYYKVCDEKKTCNDVLVEPNCAEGTIEDYFHVVAAEPEWEDAKCHGGNYDDNCPSQVDIPTPGADQIADNVSFHTVTARLGDKYGNKIIPDSIANKNVIVSFEFKNTNKLDQINKTGDPERYSSDEFTLPHTSGNSTGSLTETVDPDGEFTIKVHSHSPTSEGYDPIKNDGFNIEFDRFEYEITGGTSVGGQAATNEPKSALFAFTPTLTAASTAYLWDGSFKDASDPAATYNINVNAPKRFQTTITNNSPTLDITPNAGFKFGLQLDSQDSNVSWDNSNATITAPDNKALNVATTSFSDSDWTTINGLNSNIQANSSTTTLDYSVSPILNAGQSAASSFDTDASHYLAYSVDGQEVRHRASDTSTITTYNPDIEIAGLVQSGDGTQSKSSSALVNESIGNISISDVKSIINQNISPILKSGKTPCKETNGVVIEDLNDYWQTAICTHNNDGEVLHFQGDVTLDLGSKGNKLPSQVRTILIEGGDLTITSNLEYPSNGGPFGVIILEDENNTGGNIYIYPNVTSVAGAYYAQGSVISVNAKGTFGEDTSPNCNGNNGFCDRAYELRNQLYWKGFLASENTLGGSDKDTPECPTSIDCTNNRPKAREYDLAYLRTFHADSTGERAKNNGTVIASSAAFVIEFDSKIQNDIPPLFDIPASSTSNQLSTDVLEVHSKVAPKRSRRSLLETIKSWF